MSGANPFADLIPGGTVARQPVPNGGGGIVRIPDARGDAREGRDVRGEQRADTQLGITQRGEVRAQGNDQFSRLDTVRQRYTSDARVQRYSLSVPIFASMLNAPAGAGGDLLLVNGFAKINDPTTGVLQGESNAVGNAQSTAEGVVARVRRELGLPESGLFSPAMRQRLIVAASQRLSALNGSYNQARNEYGRFATTAGVDPQLVIGEHEAAPFRERYDQWREQNAPRRERQDDQVYQTGYDALTDDLLTTDTATQDAPITELTPVQMAGFHAFLGERGQNVTADEINQWLAQNTPFTNGLANATEIADTLRAGRPISQAIRYQEADLRQQQLEGELARRRGDVDPTQGDLATLREQGMTLGLRDEMAGLSGGVRELLSGGSFGEGYAQERDIERLWAEQARERQGWTGTLNEVGAGLLMPGGAARRAGDLLQSVPLLGRIGQGAREGVALGGAAGFGYGEGDTSLLSAAAGAAIGGPVGAIAERVIPTLANRLGGAATTPARQGAQDVVAASDAVGMAPYAGFMANGAAQRVMAGLEQTPWGGGVIGRATGRGIDEARTVTQRIANEAGTPLNSREALGNNVRTAARAGAGALRDRASRMYDSAGRLAGDARISPVRGFQTLSDAIDELADTGMGQQGLSILRAMQSRLAEGPLTVQTLRNMRTTLRDDLTTTNLRGSNVERLTNRVMVDLTQDLDDGLRAAGAPEAADLYRRADQQWAEYSGLMDEVIEPIIGRDASRSGEAVADAISRDLRGNSARSIRLLRSLPPEDQGTVRATMIARLGRASDGQQNAAGDGFSLDTFLTNWSRIEDDQARVGFFGREASEALSNLARVAQGAREAGRVRNRSNTGGAINVNGFNLADVATGGIRYWAPAIAARALTSPRFARWLGRAHTVPNPQAQRQHVERLTALARSEPTLSQDILGLQSRLREAFSATPNRIAAENENDNERNRVNRENEGGRNER